jgi:NAD(P)-dependent dehydrogenase (short-subunit alcohol dehydrogenase family)
LTLKKLTAHSDMANASDALLFLRDKVAIVTGSGKENGIGAGIAIALAGAGARVVINHVSTATAPRAAQVAAGIDKKAGKATAIVVQADISTAEGARVLVDETLSRLGVNHIDVLGKPSTTLHPHTSDG